MYIELFTLLLSSCFVTDCRPNGDRLPVALEAPLGAHEDAETRLLEDVHVVVVGVPHGPAGGVLLGLLARGRVHKATMSIRPIFKHIVAIGLRV